MAKYLEINACRDCAHEVNGRCIHDQLDYIREIKNDLIIPDWCPLPDASQSNSAGDALSVMAISLKKTVRELQEVVDKFERP